MSAIAASNITTTLLNQRRNNGRSYFNVKLAFGNGTLTYPANGVPVTAASFGLPNVIESVKFYDMGASGFSWQYDATHSTIRCFQSRDLDWTTFTPTMSWTTNTTTTAKVRVSGDTAEFLIKMVLAGAPDSAALTATLPAGYTVDTAKLIAASADAATVGTGGALHGSANHAFVIQWNMTAAQQFDVGYISSASTAAVTAVDATHPYTWANTDEVSLLFKAPVTGFGGNQLNGLYEMATGTAPAAQTLKCEVIGW